MCSAQSLCVFWKFFRFYIMNSLCWNLSSVLYVDLAFFFHDANYGYTPRQLLLSWMLFPFPGHPIFTWMPIVDCCCQPSVSLLFIWFLLCEYAELISHCFINARLSDLCVCILSLGLYVLFFLTKFSDFVWFYSINLWTTQKLLFFDTNWLFIGINEVIFVEIPVFSPNI